MAQVKRKIAAARKAAATNDRNFRTFLLVSQLEGRAIGARIAQARNEAGLTQEQLADLAVGFSRRSLQAYEAGETIPYKHLREIGSLLDRDVKWFLHGEPDADPAPQFDHADLQELRAEVRELRAAMVEMVGKFDRLLAERDPNRPGVQYRPEGFGEQTPGQPQSG